MRDWGHGERTRAIATTPKEVPGAGERLLVRTLERYGVWLRLTVAGVCGALGVVSAGAAGTAPAATCLLLPALLACGLSLRSLHRPLSLAPRWALDAAFLILIGLSQPLLGDGADLTVEAITGIAVISFQHEWATRPAVGLALAGLGAAASALGDVLSSPGHGPEAAPLMAMLVEVSLSRAAHVIVRSRAGAADRSAASRAASRREADVAAARRATEREYLATLHDTAAATLLMVSQGEGRDWSWLPLRARQDLEALSALPGFETENVDLAALLDCVPRGVGRAAVRLESRVDSPLTIPSGPGLAIFNGVREAVTNVARHSGVRDAELRAWATEGGGVVVELSDSGRGFVPKAVPARRRGLSGSVVGRMQAVGGSVSITSCPGAGTRVRWQWPGGSRDVRTPGTRGPSGARRAVGAAGSPPRSATGPPPRGVVRFLRGQLLHGAQLAALLISLAAQFGLSLQQLTAYQGVYRPSWAQTAAYVCLVAVAAVAALHLLRGRRIPPVVRRWGVGVLLAVSAVCAFTIAPERLTGAQDWAFGLLGWHALYLLADQPVRLFAAFLGAHVGLTVLVVLLAGAPTVARSAAMGVATVSDIGFQLSVGVLVGLFHRLASTAGDEALREEELRTRERLHEETQRDHRERYRALTATTVPLLVGLGHDALNPHDKAVRRRCGVEAARLRRLFAEGDAVPDPLLNELRACVEVIEHQGVTVSLAVRGRPGEVPVEVRRELVDPVAVVLGRVRSTARVTVVWTSRAVHVSVVGEDGDDGCDPAEAARARGRAAEAEVTVVRTTRGADVWVTAGWQRQARVRELTPT
ncbi:ATP-binding protein [Streptomyces sp. E5N91]|uniref:sensor histidine kinase n=1 Tax=Streptomyces sp. E5N91 TaxID=1851996 RepID=UPI001EE7ED24|nr:ATP-binding protein [Streptomyces sp. E5N91]